MTMLGFSAASDGTARTPNITAIAKRISRSPWRRSANGRKWCLAVFIIRPGRLSESVRYWGASGDGLAFPGGFVGGFVVRKDAVSAAGSRRLVGAGQPTTMFGDRKSTRL